MSNQWNNLLDTLDAVFAGRDVNGSRYKVSKRSYDNDKQEHVVHLEYRYRTKTNTSVNDKEFRRTQEKRKEREKAFKMRKQQTRKLLQDINNAAAVKYSA